MKSDVISNALIDIVGSDHVSSDDEDLISYCRDQMSPVRGKFMADFVVMAGNTEEIQKIVREANKHVVPIYPYSMGTNASGSALPIKGGIILDLRRMNKIFEINDETMTATIQPGVSWGALKKEAARKGLQSAPLGGPYTGGPVGNYTNAPVTPYATRYTPDRVVSLEAVLGTGELIRTGSAAFPGHETINPYFRYAYGPDITGLFRGNFGAFGIITKMVYHLYPIGELEESVEGGFANLSNALQAMQEVERYDMTKRISVHDNQLSALWSADIEKLKDPVEVERLEASFPNWYLSAGLSGSREQVRLYQKMVSDIIGKNKGFILDLPKRIKGDINNALSGVGTRQIRMFAVNGSTGWLIAAIPMSKVVELRDRVINEMKELDIQNPITKKPLLPTSWFFSYDRGRNAYVELDFAYDSLDTDTVRKIRKLFLKVRHETILPLGGSSLVAPTRTSNPLMPAYEGLLRCIKKKLDPNGILSPGMFLEGEV